jgi:DNA-directed RNA polymerase subunit M/transcription elongation factor TFIIS
MATYKTKTIYKCRECGATSYQQMIDRAQNGALIPTGQYRCTGCRNIFSSIRSWWEPRPAPELQSHSRFG